jgi:hypothetical protein
VPYSLIAEPGYQGPLNLGERLPNNLGNHGPASARAHEVPHRGDRRFASTLIGWLAVIRYEMKIAAAIMDVELLDFIGAHRETHGAGIGARDRRWVRARGADHRMRRGPHV